MGSQIENAIFVAWERIFPLLKSDPGELARRLERRRRPMLTQPPRAYCIAVRASDNRVNAWNTPCIPEKFATLTDRRFLHPGPHEVTLTKPLLELVTAPVDLSFWRANDLSNAAEKLGVSPAALRHQRKTGTFRIDFVPHAFGRKQNVPFLMNDVPRDPCGRNGHKPAEPEWNNAWQHLANGLPDCFQQTVTRVPCMRMHNAGERFRGWRWVCPVCEAHVSSIFLPRRIMTVGQFVGHEQSLITSGTDEVRPFAQTFACTRCHRIRYWSSLHHNSWNHLVAYLSGGLLYGSEVARPDCFAPRRQKAYARHKSKMIRGKEVEQLLLKRKSYLQIADAMGLTLSGVQGHVKRLYKKRGIRSRAELLAQAERSKFQNQKGAHLHL